MLLLEISISSELLHHFLPGTPVLSFGTAGCNLSCKFCQNWDITKSREMDTLADYASPEDIASAAERLGCRSVAFTYNDPVIFLEYARDVAAACKRERVSEAVAVTAGYINDCSRESDFFSFVDAANIDLKAFDDGVLSARSSGGHLRARARYAPLSPARDRGLVRRSPTSSFPDTTTPRR